MVEHAQRQRLEDDRIGEAALDGEDGGAGEVQLALAVSANGSGEPVVLEVAQGCRIDHVVVAEETKLVVTEAEVAHQAEQAPGAGDDPEPAPAREAA